MSVESIGAYAGVQPSAAKATKLGASNLTISDFFQLIAAQLQNQSMYDTVDNAEFMSQMVQFSTLSQMEELSRAFRTNLAVSMIGKSVNVSTTNEQGAPITVSGTVTQVRYDGDTPLLMVDGAYYKLSDVAEVGIGTYEQKA